MNKCNNCGYCQNHCNCCEKCREEEFNEEIDDWEPPNCEGMGDEPELPEEDTEDKDNII